MNKPGRTVKIFDEALIIQQLKAQYSLTFTAMMHQTVVKKISKILDKNQGEIQPYQNQANIKRREKLKKHQKYKGR